jgi:hypothetical protein
MKDVIVEDWVEGLRADCGHLPKPFYLDYLVVLEISLCTGHSRRTTLWTVLRQSALRNYLRNLVGNTVMDDFDIIVACLSNTAPLRKFGHQ